MNQAAVTETYSDVERMIGMLVDRCQSRFGGDRDELLSEANIAFMRAYKMFDPKKARFTTYLYHKVWGTLRRHCNTRISRQKRIGGVVQINEDLTPTAREFNLHEFSKLLTEDAMFVAQIALETPNDLKQVLLTKKLKRPSWIRTLRRHLLDMGWTMGRIKESFAEIKSIL